MGKKTRVTISDLANALELSIATISRGVRGDPAIKEATRDRILTTAVSLGYGTSADGVSKSSTGNINSDVPEPDNQKATIYDIASLLNLSVATVSRALNDSNQVKDATKQKVQSTAKALDFQFNNDAKGLVNSRNHASSESKAATIYDIAQKLGISPSTVSRCLSNKPGVKKRTKRLVLKVASEIGYTSNVQATQLRTRGVITIAVLVPGFTSIVNSILAGIEKVAGDEGTGLLISNALSFRQDTLLRTEKLLELTDGIIIIPGDNKDVDTLFKKIRGFTKPGVYLGTLKTNTEYENITIDMFTAVYDLTIYLIERGCRHLCFVDPVNDLAQSAERLRGFKTALRDNGLSTEKNFIYQEPIPNKGLDAVAESILSNPYLPDGIILINSHFGSKSIAALNNAGIDTANAIVVCELEYSITDTNDAQKTGTMTVDFNDLGEKAIRRLIMKLVTPSRLPDRPPFAKHHLYVNQPRSVYN